MGGKRVLQSESKDLSFLSVLTDTTQGDFSYLLGFMCGLWKDFKLRG